MTPPQAARKAEPAISDIVMMDALPLGRAIRAKQVSCVEVMNAYLDHIDRFNPKVNAIVSMRERKDLIAQAQTRDEQLKRGEDMGPLHGMPQAIKDLAATKGIRTTQGSPIYKDAIPTDDALIVERARNAGAIIIGKTNVPEFGLGSQTYNPVFGLTRNAYDQTKTSGGSSGGAGVALALRMLPVADGSDHGGSLRNPGRLQQRARLPHLLRPRAASHEDALPDRPQRQGTDGAHGRGPADAAVGAGRLRRPRAAVDRRSAHLCGGVAEVRRQGQAHRLARRLRQPADGGRRPRALPRRAAHAGRAWAASSRR